MRILIGALSGWQYQERRERCRTTWMADAAELGVRSVFLLGCPAMERPELVGPHCLCLPCPDDYPSLPQRTRWFCKWALGEEEPEGDAETRGRGDAESCSVPASPCLPFSASPSLPPWDYLFKCDDDTYVSIPRLLAYDLAGRDYIGAEWRPGVGYASGGAGYFLSRRAAAVVAEKLTQATGAEDLLVGQVLREAGMHLSIEPRLIPFGSIQRRPRPENDLITLHGVAADAFLASHAETGLHASVA